MSLEALNFAVCFDCICHIANNENSDDLSDIDHMLILKATRNLCYDGEELGFSWTPCDACKRPYGGDRYKACKLVVRQD